MHTRHVLQLTVSMGSVSIEAMPVAVCAIPAGLEMPVTKVGQCMQPYANIAGVNYIVHNILNIQ